MRRARRKAEELAPYIERAQALIPPLDEAADIEPIDSYPVMIQKTGAGVDSNTIGKRLEASVGANS